MKNVPTLLLAFTLPLAAQDPAAPPQANANPLAVLAALPLQPELARGVRVVVRDAAGAPAPGAQVVFAAADAPQHAELEAEAQRLHPGDEPRLWAHRARGGTRYQVDERGATRVPAVTGLVVAWQDGVVAARSFGVREGQQPNPIELDLKPAVAFTVTVVDDRGEPAADVPLGVVGAPAPAAWAYPRHRTDARGTAPLRLLPRSRAARVRLLVATREPIDAELPPHGGTVTLRLPACGTVRATLRGELLPGASTTWTLIDGDRELAATASEQRSATFRFVEPGFTGTARVVVDELLVEAPVTAGPAGAEVAVELARETGRTVVLRVLDAAGTPARSAWVGVAWVYARGSSTTSTRTTTEGWIEVDAPAFDGDAKLRLELRGRRWDDDVVGTLALELAAADKGRVDRGEQRFAPVPVALRGVLVDAAGKPLPDVQIEVDRRSYHARSGADGRFALSVPGDQTASLQLKLPPGWYFTAPTSRTRTVEPGADARLVLQPAGRVRFEAQGVPHGVGMDLDVLLEPVTAGGERVELDFDPTAKVLLMPPGQWHFVVAEAGRELHRIEDVRVDTGVEVHDPRFMRFDWQAFATVVTVRVEDASGKPTDACTVWRHYAHYGSGRSPHDGVSHWFVPKDGSRMRVEPDDKNHATIDLGLVTGEVAVRIGAGPRLTLELSKPPRLPPGAVLVAIAGDGHEGAPFDANGKAAVWVAKAGGCRVELAVRRGGETNVLTRGATTCEVPAAGHTLRIELTGELQAEIDRSVPR